MKRTIAAIFILCLCIGVALCVPQIRRAVLFRTTILAESPLDEASAQVPRLGQYKEFTIDDPVYDCLIYYFDGTKGSSPTEVVSGGIKAIRGGGFRHKKKMTLVIFCNLTTTGKSSEAIYPFGLFLESAAIRNHTIPVGNLASQPLVAHPMNWDGRISDWIYTTNNATKNGPDVAENANYVKFTNALERGWFMDLDNLTNKTEVYTKFGVPRYYVRESGTYSEIYPVDDTERGQAGTVRIWYDGDRVTNTGCYMTNK
jgi:hypothetical protein